MLLCCAIALTCGVLLSSCGLAPVPPSTPEPISTSVPSESPAPVIPGPDAGAETVIRAAWKGSKHADTYVTDDRGENNECARCHSPLNWVPTSAADLPAQCVSCKFTVSSPKPVPRTEWNSVGCEICHRVDNGVVTAEVAWLDTLIAQYETASDPYKPVATHSELCVKCHRDTEARRYARDLGNDAHVGFGCSDCHDVHSTRADCAGCHADALDPAKAVRGHTEAHGRVMCVACHDASGLKVGPVEDGTWMPFRAGEPYVSHNLRRAVDCARCHFTGNPWNLKTGVD